MLILTPLIGILLLAITPACYRLVLKLIALIFSSITFTLSLLLWVWFDNSNSQFQFTDTILWIPHFNLNFVVGIDGISLFLVILTTFLILLCILASWDSISIYVKEYFIAFLFLDVLLISVFCVLDLLLFYVLFESVLIPMFLIIGIWGGDNRLYATFKFFLYTLSGSVLMLLGIIYIISITGTGNIEVIAEYVFDNQIQLILFLCFSSALRIFTLL